MTNVRQQSPCNNSSQTNNSFSLRSFQSTFIFLFQKHFNSKQNQFEDEFITELNNELHLSPYFSSRGSYHPSNTKFFELSLTKRKQSDSPNRHHRKTYGGYEESVFSHNIKQHRRTKLFNESCQRGAPEDIQLLANHLQNYPKKFLRSTVDPEHLINKKFLGQTPLYVAAKNGNLQIVQFLLANDAQTEIPAVLTIGKKVINETPLEVAVRWQHKLIVSELIQKGISEKGIKKALQTAPTKQMKDFINQLLSNQFK